MGKLSSLELPRHRTLFLCSKGHPLGMSLNVTEPNCASKDHRQHSQHRAGPSVFWSPPETGVGISIPAGSSVSTPRGQFYKEMKTYLKPLFYLTKAQVLFQDTWSQRSQNQHL